MVQFLEKDSTLTEPVSTAALLGAPPCQVRVSVVSTAVWLLHRDSLSLLSHSTDKRNWAHSCAASFQTGASLIASPLVRVILLCVKVATLSRVAFYSE